MRRTLMSLAAAAAIGTAGMAASTQPANAAPWWVAPAIVGGVLVGGVVGAAAAQHHPAYYGANAYYVPQGAVQGTIDDHPLIDGRPVVATSCYLVDEPVPGGYRRVRICE